MGNQPYIVGVGAANLDLNGASCAPIHLRDSNPGHISLSAGGVTRNVCENLARLGADVKLLSCVGDDVFGSYIRRSCVEGIARAGGVDHLRRTQLPAKDRAGIIHIEAALRAEADEQPLQALA